MAEQQPAVALNQFWRMVAGILSLGMVVTGVAFATGWLTLHGIEGASIPMAVVEFWIAGLFGYAAITGRSPLPRDRKHRK